MSQNPQPVFAQPMKTPQPLQPPKENGFGLAGFIVSIAGLLLCGIPSIFGVILSLIGLRKEPKGLAIAGLILGLLGIVELAFAGFLAISFYRVAQDAGSFFQEIAIETQLNEHASAIGDEWESNDLIPTQAEGDAMLLGKRDMIGNQIVYETDGTSFTLRSAGPDGTLETEDDVTVGPFVDVESTRQPVFDEEFDWDASPEELESIKELMDKAKEQ
jgi:hypothetical protein